jgi:lysophospholipase L1-like esterase
MLAILGGIVLLVGCPADEIDGTPTDGAADDDGADDDAGDDDAADDDAADDDAGDDDAADDDAGDDDAGDDDVGDDDAGDDDSGDDDTALTVDDCFANAFVSPPPIGPDYDQFGPTVGSHCYGTNHQQIQGIERVVFLGDSVTTGTPPWLGADYYRSDLAGQLAQQFNLTPPSALWEMVNIFDGTGLVQESGDFAVCSKWGARTDDLILDNTQIEDCIPPDERDKTTLVVMTIGGNDIANITQDGLDGVPIADIWQDVYDFTDVLRGAVEWFFDTPGKFPNGVYIVFANMFEFTDGTGDTNACPAAALAGFGAPWDDPAALADMVIFANEEYMSIAVDNQVDLIFALEEFCGHGFNHEDPSAPCYRGPNTPIWIDFTCIHPNPEGHDALANMFMSVVQE